MVMVFVEYEAGREYVVREFGMVRVDYLRCCQGAGTLGCTDFLEPGKRPHI